MTAWYLEPYPGHNLTTVYECERSVCRASYLLVDALGEEWPWWE